MNEVKTTPGSTPAPAAGGRRKRTGGVVAAQWAAILVMLGGFYWFFMPHYCAITPKTIVNNAIANGRQIVLACRSYAHDHGGAFPPTLEALYPEYLDVMEIFQDREGQMMWDYQAGHQIEIPAEVEEGVRSFIPPTEAEKVLPLIWSKDRVAKLKYVVGYVGGNVAAMDEAPGPGSGVDDAQEGGGQEQ